MEIEQGDYILLKNLKIIGQITYKDHIRCEIRFFQKTGADIKPKYLTIPCKDLDLFVEKKLLLLGEQQ